MTDTVPATAIAAADAATFTLDHPIVIAGEEKIASGATITVRRPKAGELRGLSLSALTQADYGALEALAPRITSPVLHKQMVAAMDTADLAQFAGEVLDFLLPKAARAAVYGQ